MGRVVSPTPTPLSSRPVVPALVASYDMHGRAVGLLYTQPTGQSVSFGRWKPYTAGVGQLWWTETLHCRCGSALVDRNLTLQVSVSFGIWKPYTAGVSHLWWIETLHCRCGSALGDRNLTLHVWVSFGGQKPYAAGVSQLWYMET